MFQVLSQSALAAHNNQVGLDPSQLQHLHLTQNRGRHGQLPLGHVTLPHGHVQLPQGHVQGQVQLPQGHVQYQQGHVQLSQDGQLYAQYNGDFTGLSIAGPQVETVRSKPRQSVHVDPGRGYQVYDDDKSAHHIYMEVDPMYNGMPHASEPMYNTGMPHPSTPMYNSRMPHSVTQVELLSSPSEEELARSSNSSQSSSGYSTAPSDCYAASAQQHIPTSAQHVPFSSTPKQQPATSHKYFAKDAPGVFFITGSAEGSRRKTRERSRGNISQEHPLLFQEDSQVI